MSGARNCPETPRQKMIGMMYLVLTAMLALNVSVEILNGFTVVDNSLHATIESTEARNNFLYDDFKTLEGQNKAKVGDWLKKALVVKAKSDELFNYIETFKKEIVRLTDGDKANDSAYVFQIEAKDNLDKAGEYAIVKGHGETLKKKIDSYKDFLIGISEPKKQEIYKRIFSTEKFRDGKSWKEGMFDMLPVASVITNLTKYQSDIRSAEGELVQYLKAQTDVKDLRVNKLDALVIPDSKYIIRGGKYSAKIVLSARDTTQQLEYYIGNTPVKGGKYEISCNKSGSFNYSGKIMLKGNDGIARPVPFSSDYVVGDPAATMSNDALNVMYRGIDNVFSISVPGVAQQNVSIRVNGGTFQKAGTKFVIKPTQDGEITVNVFAKIDGRDLPMGGGAYRVKYLPNPTAFLQFTDASGLPKTFQDGTVSKKTLKSGINLIASYGSDELVKANFTVVSFTMLTSLQNSINATGSRLNARQLSEIDKLEGGDIVLFKNIKAVGPDGKTRTLGIIQLQI